MKNIRKNLILGFGAVLLLASCSKDKKDPWSSDNVGIDPKGIEVAQLSDKVTFTAKVYNAESANILLVNADKSTTKIASDLQIDEFQKITATFTKAQLGLAKVDDKATLKVEAIRNGEAYLASGSSTITVVKTWKDVELDKVHSTLEGNTLVDTLTFSVDPGSWKEPGKAVTFAATYTVVKAASQTATLIATETSAKFVYNVDALGMLADTSLHRDVFKISVVASYEGLTETLEYSFTVSEDQLKESVYKELSAANLLSTNTAPWTKQDSAQTFVNLLTGNSFTGLVNAAKQDTSKTGEKGPKLYLTKSGSDLKIYALPSIGDTTQVWYTTSDSLSCAKRSRIAAEAQDAAITTSLETNGITVLPEGDAGAYYLIKVAIVDKGKTEVYYGYLKLEEATGSLGISEGVVTGAKYTFYYAKKRDYQKE